MTGAQKWCINKKSIIEHWIEKNLSKFFPRRYAMISKKPLYPQRVRKINGSFAFIEHQFLRKGFWEDLNHHELLLYFFLILAADRNGSVILQL
jgi:hypothetical protein